MRLILLGPPGAGKGTQCKRIIDKYALTHLSSGDILRAQRAGGTALGKKAQAYMDSGALVPDDLIIEMMIGAIKKAGGNFVLDGFPRTVAQADGLTKALKKAGEKIDAIVNLVVADEVISARLTGRRSCPKCGAVYHIVNVPAKVAGKCDKGCGPLVQRDDDKPQVVENRLRTYHQQTEAVVGYYEGKDSPVLNIEADRSAEAVTADIIAQLQRLAG